LHGTVFLIGMVYVLNCEFVGFG